MGRVRVRGSALLFWGMIFALYWWSGNAGVGDISRFESCRNWGNLQQQAGFQKYPLYILELFIKRRERKASWFYRLE